MPLVSVILPTYNERENIEPLVKTLARVLHGYDYEIIVVDDNSPDGTAEIAESLSREYPVKVIKRPGRLGLTSAIYDGIRASSGDYIVVMDADFQHPPELIPELVKKLEEYDLVIASRYTRGGGIEKWSLIRRVISIGAILATRILIPECRGVKDPVSGFFAVKKNLVSNWTPMEPRGYKALVEIIHSTKPMRICEVPYVFKGREKGASKLRFKEIFSYAKLLIRLSWKPLFLILLSLIALIVLAIIAL